MQALEKFSAVIPHLVETKLMESHGKDSVPRLTPADLRQFWQSQRKSQGNEDSKTRGQGAEAEKPAPGQEAEKPGPGQGSQKPGRPHRAPELRKAWQLFLSNISGGETLSTQQKPETGAEMEQEGGY